MKRIFSIIILICFLSGCSGSAPSEGDIQTAIAKTVAVKPTEVYTNTPIAEPTNTPLPTNTPRPTNTSKPTNTATPTLDLSKIIAKNYVASYDSGGVIVEVARIVIAEKTSLRQDFSSVKELEDKPIVVEFIFKIVNNTDKTINLYVDQGTAAVNGEQIKLMDYAWAGTDFGDDIGGEFLPGVTAIGGLWVGVKRTPFEEINKIIISIGSPTDKNYHSLGQDYYFEIDTTGWTFEDLPSELK